VPAALDLARHNGKLYGVPIWVRPMTIFYKKSLFDKCGLSAPNLQISQPVRAIARFDLPAV